MAPLPKTLPDVFLNSPGRPVRTTDDLGKLDPDQLHHLIDAQKDVDHRMEEVNKLVEEHGDALDQLKSLMAGVTSQSLPGVLVIGPWQSLPRRLNSWRMAEFL
ncbi:unnamed protein product [Durusdinium trenchii]|uniref:Uncharacterized protein n=2 Tax=Durusdinium trenchii TaxID=1381693 RepID=A0ABP0RT59_9DINO